MLFINDFDSVVVLTYVLLWSTLYFLLCMWYTARGYEWHCRLVTAVHAITAFLMMVYCTTWVGPSPFTDSGGPNSPLQTRIVSMSLGYFLFDLMWCVYFKTEGLVMLAHHLLCILGLSWCLLAGCYGTEIVAILGGAEVTNPLLQLRWFLRETGRYKSILGDLTDWTFMISFGLVRIGLGSKFLYSYYQQGTDFWGRVGATSIYIIGWIFFINIIAFAIRKYFRKRHKGIKSH